MAASEVRQAASHARRGAHRSISPARRARSRRVRPRRGDRRTGPSTSWIRDGDVHPRRRRRARGLRRSSRAHRARRRPVDDRGRRHRAFGRAVTGRPRERRTRARLPDLGELAGEAQDDQAALSGGAVRANSACRDVRRQGARGDHCRRSARRACGDRHAHPDRLPGLDARSRRRCQHRDRSRSPRHGLRVRGCRSRSVDGGYATVSSRSSAMATSYAFELPHRAGSCCSPVSRIASRSLATVRS